MPIVPLLELRKHRLVNAMARLMGTYQDGLLTLQKLRSGGNQTVTVQHVNVAAGAQAVIGNVRTGGPGDARTGMRAGAKVEGRGDGGNEKCG